MVSGDFRHVVNKGAGNPPFLWDVKIHPKATAEEKKCLSETEAEHIKDQVRELARCEDPTRPSTLSVKPIGGYHELREKHGPLGRKNVRVFFTTMANKMILVLGVYKKEEDGKTPPYVVELMAFRRRKALAHAPKVAAKARR